jgi:hypothetical protein
VEFLRTRIEHGARALELGAGARDLERNVLTRLLKLELSEAQLRTASSMFERARSPSKTGRLIVAVMDLSENQPPF